ncbi:CotY/CotZ family spore coat protein [Heyndrickxia sporothermodurans]
MEGMIDEMISIIGNKQDICEALLELKSLQDLLEKSKTKYFGKLLFQLVGVDTIPIFLYTNDGLLTQMGVDIDYKTGKEYTFTSNYFRIESIDEEKFYASLSILCPLDIHGDVTQHHCEVMKLIKTTTCTEVDLSCIRAIQTLDLDLLKRKIIIEPKW